MSQEFKHYRLPVDSETGRRLTDLYEQGKQAMQAASDLVHRLRADEFEQHPAFAQGDTILDTHLGSGSSRIAAYKMGFDFTGCEIDPEYYDLQERRFRKECLGEVETPDGKTFVQQSLF